jgi:hypothetical protein
VEELAHLAGGGAVEVQEHGFSSEEPTYAHGVRPAATQRREEHIDGRQVVAGTRVSGGDAVPYGT